MKRILLFAPTNGGTTIGGISLNLYKALSNRKDLEVRVVLIFKNDKGKFDFGDCAYYSKSELKPKLISQIKKIIWFKKVKKEFGPDITINTLFICSIISVLSGGKDKKIGIFHSPHEQAGISSKLSLFISYLNYIFIYPKLDKLFCVSQEICDSITNRFKKIEPQKVQVVYNIHNTKEILEKSNELIDDCFAEIFKNQVLLFCGRLDINKAPIRLVNAFLAALNELPETVNIVFIGTDTDHLWDDILTIIKNNKLCNRVHYIGNQINPYKFIKHASALVSCSFSEGLPGVIIESLLLKTPVISTNSSKGVWEIMSESDKYSKDLSSIFVNKYGIITPNQSYNNDSFVDSDVKNLSIALEQFFKIGISFDTFDFESKISPNTITESYII